MLGGDAAHAAPLPDASSNTDHSVALRLLAFMAIF
jgi:hypothetical protein